MINHLPVLPWASSCTSNPSIFSTNIFLSPVLFKLTLLYVCKYVRKIPCQHEKKLETILPLIKLKFNYQNLSRERELANFDVKQKHKSYHCYCLLGISPFSAILSHKPHFLYRSYCLHHLLTFCLRGYFSSVIACIIPGRQPSFHHAPINFNWEECH